MEIAGSYLGTKHKDKAKNLIKIALIGCIYSKKLIKGRYLMSNF